ncbi:MAG: DUF4278 domain-containing protein [Cyanobacteria bacterium P01_F01_bin.56]
MKLTYRGVQYDYNPPAVAMNRSAEVGKYRGVDIRFRTVKSNPVQQPTLDLVYRGVAYHTGAAEATPVANAAVPVADAPAALADLELKARTLLMGHNRNVKRRQQAMLTRLAADVGLEADVTQSWNRIQGKVHPSFWATYDRGGSAAS